jgi:hypothetical protein
MPDGIPRAAREKIMDGKKLCGWTLNPSRAVVMAVLVPVASFWSVPAQAGVQVCYGDNDWTGSTSCFTGWPSSGSGWSYMRNTKYSFYYNDAEVTSSSGKEADYWWNAPRSGYVTFYAWIPANYATASVTYHYGCLSDYDGWDYSVTVDQNAYSATWKRLGTSQVFDYPSCYVMLTSGKKSDGTAGYTAADGVYASFAY